MLHRLRRLSSPTCLLPLALATAPLAPAAPALLPAEIITATRTPQPAEQVAATVFTFDAPTLRHTPALTLDGALRSLPAFSLFRRSDSLTANPTAQGVSLRGLGPSGASRSLVLLDGVPLNDPFGGWVAWTKLPRETLQQVEIVPGGGATAWGNAALGGVIQALGTAPGVRTTQAAATFGDYGTRSIEFSHTQPGGRGALDIAGRAFATDGWKLVAPEHQGPVDIPAWSRHRWLTARWRQPLGDTVQLAVTLRGYEEKRGNGTAYQQNSTREKFASVSLSGQPATTFGWRGVIYGQDQAFASTFGAVNATRTVETPASDQFDVPARAAGAAWTGTWQHAVQARTSAGADLRTVRGETREHFTYANGDFTRQRVAGGRQDFAGVFALHERPIAPQWRATVGARLDAWRDTNGHRHESDRATGVRSRDERYADRDDVEFSPSAGLVYSPTAALRLRANAQHAFRRPTLNELYRPFRVGPNITEANAALRTERVTSAELGAEWTLFRSSPRPIAKSETHVSSNGFVTTSSEHSSRDVASQPLLTLSATAFHNDLRDAVGNVTLVHGPGAYPLFGFVPANGVGRQRLNLDRTRVRGLELSAAWRPFAALALSADYLYNDATVRRAVIAPDLVGKRLAQVARHSAALGATWSAPGGFTLTPRLRWLGRQFEDDENRLPLGEVVVADLNVARPLTPHLELFLTCENLGDARIETGRNASGLVNVGTPRLFVAGLRGSW